MYCALQLYHSTIGLALAARQACIFYCTKNKIKAKTVLPAARPRPTPGPVPRLAGLNIGLAARPRPILHLLLQSQD